MYIIVSLFGAVIYLLLMFALFTYVRRAELDFKLRYNAEVDYLHGDIITAGTSGDGKSEKSASNPKEAKVDSLQTFVNRALRLLPSETFAIYPALKTASSAFSVDLQHTIASIITLFSVYFLRSHVVPKDKRQQLIPLLASLLICILWIYSVSGYLFYPATKMGISQQQAEAIAVILLFTVGLTVPAKYMGERNIVRSDQ